MILNLLKLDIKFEEDLDAAVTYDYIRERLSVEGYLKPQTIVILSYDEEAFDELIDWNDFHKQTIKYLKKIK